MVEIVKNVNETTDTFKAIMVLGLVGLLFLIVFGNLSGNLGFSDTSSTTTNESGHFINGTIDTLGQASVSTFTGATLSSVLNASNGVVIAAGNFTFDSTLGTIVGSVGRTENFSSVNITYVSTFTSAGEIDTDSVITNLTGGASTFFTFSNVWFTLLAIVLLIIIVIAVINVVSKKENGGFSN